MHKSKKAWILVLSVGLLLKLFSLFPPLVEKYYSRGFYLGVSSVQRRLFGWLPFSIGDLFYSLVILYLLVRLVRFIRPLVKRQALPGYWRNGLQWLVFWALGVYLVFNILWGLNYNRLGAAHQLQLSMQPYNTRDLQEVLQVLQSRLQQYGPGGLLVRDNYRSKKELFDSAAAAYLIAADSFPFLAAGGPASVKPSLFSYLGDYLGYTGYYNPFSGEAQVNTTVPVFIRPFTTCHELGHQLGYAKENEANFSGYLAARSSGSPAFRYSVYFDLYSYGIRELFGRDSLAARALHARAPELVKKDFKELRDFFTRYENPLEPLIRKIYGQYLRANEQPSGMESYNEVMAFLVACSKKYGAQSL